MSPLAAIANPAKLGQVVLYSLIAGVGISAVAALGVSSAAGLLDAMRERRTAAVLAWASLATLCMAVVVAAVIVGVVAMSTK
ncbi:MAG TPA: hypothetical protein VE992_05755 [Solirubrobacteraceae bacterium]|nr:hypothetical protein [Solirubrobacteraceae bacterium]